MTLTFTLSHPMGEGTGAERFGYYCTIDRNQRVTQARRRGHEGVSPEWPLDKASIIAGSAFPVTAAVGDFDEPPPWLVEQGIGFGSVFDRSGLATIGSKGN